MSHSHSYGEPIKVVNFSKNNEFFINEERLKLMFEHKDVKHRSVVAFTIIGAFRKGKSFFLDYCLRYLYAHYPSINHPKNSVLHANDWIGDEDEPLKGFSWRTGTIRDTSGIVVWSDIFLHTMERTGEKVAILVMDTQGLFDNETSSLDNSRIFAIGTLVSSIQVLNLTSIIQEDQLQYLQFATEFAQFAAHDAKSSEKPFQNLMFLIRDWNSVTDFDFGIKGGKAYLKSIFQTTKNQNAEIKSVRDHIQNSFEKLDCSLLPNPGKTVAGGKKLKTPYNGNWGGMEEDFREEFFELIDYLLKPKNLVSKKINGEFVKSSVFLDLFLNYIKLFQSNKLPKAKGIYQFTVDQQLNTLVDSCIERYKELIFENEKIIQNIKSVSVVHYMCKNEALETFKLSKKMGNQNDEESFRKILEDKLETLYTDWKKQKLAALKMIEEERKKTIAGLEEKLRLQEEQFNNEREAWKRLEEMQKLHFKNQQALKDKDIEIAQARYEAEKKRCEYIELLRKRDKAFTAALLAQPKVSIHESTPCKLM